MQKDASKLARVAQGEIALLRPVQHLLEKLAKGNSSNGKERCMALLGGKIPIQIKAASPLPKHFTISVPGKRPHLSSQVRSFSFPNFFRQKSEQINF